MITFGSIDIEGFGSMAKPITFLLNQPGLNIIRGKVGSGKTTIPSALSWCLFGKTLKEKSSIETWEEKRPTSYRGTKVLVDLMVGKEIYTIVRCLNFKGKIKVGDKKMKGGNNLFIFKNLKPITEARNKADKQELINKLTGYSFDLFKSSIVFGQKMKKIIEESGPQKKKIFEEAFEVAFIEEAKDETKVELQKLKEAHYDIDQRIENLLDKIEDKKGFYKEALEDEKNFEKERKEDIREIRQEIEEYQEELKNLASKGISKKTAKRPKEIQGEIQELEESLEYVKENNHQIMIAEDELEDNQDKLKVIQKKLSSKDKTCPTCGGKMNKEANKKYRDKLKGDKAVILGKIDAIRKVLNNKVLMDAQEVRNKLSKARGKKSEIEKEIAKSEEAQKQVPKIKEKIKSLEGKIVKLENKKLKIKSTTYKKDIDKLEKKLDTQKKDLKKLSQDIEIKEWLIKDPLSNNGLKAYMFNTLLSQVNDALDDYSRILGFRVEFGIDLDTARKDFYQAIEFEGVISPYEDLSGGQKQLVDTSIAFAIHDVISKIRPTNILFMDEPFESLGVDEIEIIEELVETKAQDKALFLITHHESFNPRNTNDIIITRSKGISKIN